MNMTEYCYESRSQAVECDLKFEMESSELRILYKTKFGPIKFATLFFFLMFEAKAGHATINDKEIYIVFDSRFFCLYTHSFSV